MTIEQLQLEVTVAEASLQASEQELVNNNNDINALNVEIAKRNLIIAVFNRNGAEIKSMD